MMRYIFLHTATPTDKSQVVRPHKNTKDLPNTITMVAELLAPPAALIQWIHTAWVVGGIVHVLSEASVKGFC